MELLKIQEQMKKELPPELFKHSAGVAQTAADLATALQTDAQKAYLAGLLHDYARQWPAAELLAFARNNNIVLDKQAEKQPVLLHGAVGAVLAQRLGIQDRDVLSAIANHTLGYPEMPLLAEIIYLADKIEPNRLYPGVERLRSLAGQDFRSALLEAAAHSITYIIKKRQIVHPLAISYWNWLVEREAGGE